MQEHASQKAMPNRTRALHYPIWEVKHHTPKRQEKDPKGDADEECRTALLLQPKQFASVFDWVVIVSLMSASQQSSPGLHWQHVQLLPALSKCCFYPGSDLDGTLQKRQQICKKHKITHLSSHGDSATHVCTATHYGNAIFKTRMIQRFAFLYFLSFLRRRKKKQTTFQQIYPSKVWHTHHLHTGTDAFIYLFLNTALSCQQLKSLAIISTPNAVFNLILLSQ